MTGKYMFPIWQNIPQTETATTWSLILQNINFTITEKKLRRGAERPDFPYLTLISGDQEYRMEKVAANQYSVTKWICTKSERLHQSS